MVRCAVSGTFYSSDHTGHCFLITSVSATNPVIKVQPNGLKGSLKINPICPWVRPKIIGRLS